MSLIQRNVISLLVLLAVVGAGVGILTVSSPFASGQETESCDPGVGISIATTNASGQTFAVVNHGDDVYYSVKLFKEESLCDFGGGTLTVTLPGATDDYPDGTVTIPVSNTDGAGNVTDSIITLGDSYNSDRLQYTVNQNDGIQGNADDQGSVELTVRAVYSGGRSLDSDGNQLPNEVDATATSIVRIGAPLVEIDISPRVEDLNNPDTQSVLQGQTAYFDVVIKNTGGFELSNISVASLEDAAVGEVQIADCERSSDAFGALAVGTSTTAYQCGSTTEATFVLRAEVTASGTAQSTAGEAASLVVTNDDTTTVIFGTVDVGIAIANQPGFDIVRYDGEEGNDEGAFTITPETPAGSDLESVTISVEIFEGDVTEYPVDLAGYTYISADGCVQDLGTVAAGTTSADQAYNCTGKMYDGLSSIWVTITGTIPGTTTELRARDYTQVETIIPGLTVELIRDDPTIRKNTSTIITVKVTNDGDSLSGVEVVDPTPGDAATLNLVACDIPLDQVGDMETGQIVEIQCSTGNLIEETVYEAVAIGNARDNTREPSGVATAIVKILAPSTDISVSLLEGGSSVVQLVVQTVVVTETNDGDSDLTNVYVDVAAAGIGPDLTGQRLTKDSPEFVRSYSDSTVVERAAANGVTCGMANDDDVLNPCETWEWRVVVVGVTGNVVLLEADATSIDVTANGYGTDALGEEVNPETDADETETQSIPFSVN